MGYLPMSSKANLAESTALFKSEQKTTSNSLSLILSLSSIDCLMPNSDNSTSCQPDEISFSLLVVVPWTKYVIFKVFSFFIYFLSEFVTTLRAAALSASSLSFVGLPGQGSNLKSPLPKSGVLPITPPGNL